MNKVNKKIKVSSRLNKKAVDALTPSEQQEFIREEKVKIKVYERELVKKLTCRII